MRGITEQRASSIAPSLPGPPVVDASFDDRSWISCADYVRNRQMPVPEQPLQFRFRAFRFVICALGLVRSTPPSRAATTNRHQTDPNPWAKRLGEQRAGGKIAD